MFSNTIEETSTENRWDEERTPELKAQRDLKISLHAASMAFVRRDLMQVS